jgi:hypothetical protein
MAKKLSTTPDNGGASTWVTAGTFVTADSAIEILQCSRSLFYERVKAGIYREAELRAGDPAPTEKTFRLPDLVVDEERRIHECTRRGRKHGWERVYD